MPLESIIEHILDKSRIQADRIIQDANTKAAAIIEEAKKETDAFYKEAFGKEKIFYERQKQKAIVNARLEGKKSLLKAKQDLIDAVFEKLSSAPKRQTFKKEQVLHDKVCEVALDNVDFYMNKLRQHYEGEIAKILFGQEVMTNDGMPNPNGKA